MERPRPFGNVWARGALIDVMVCPTFRHKVGGKRRFNRRAFHRYRSNKTVAPPGNSFNETWIVGIVVESGTDLFKNDIQAAVEVDISPFRPQLLTQFLSGNDFAGALQQKKQHAKWLVLKPDAQTAAAQRAAAGVGLEPSKAKDAHSGSKAFHDGGQREVAKS